MKLYELATVKKNQDWSMSIFTVRSNSCNFSHLFKPDEKKSQFHQLELILIKLRDLYSTAQYHTYLFSKEKKVIRIPMKSKSSDTRRENHFTNNPNIAESLKLSTRIVQRLFEKYSRRLSFGTLEKKTTYCIFSVEKRHTYTYSRNRHSWQIRGKFLSKL